MDTFKRQIEVLGEVARDRYATPGAARGAAPELGALLYRGLVRMVLGTWAITAKGRKLLAMVVV